MPRLHAGLGDLIGIDGSLIDAVPTMQFADYRNGVQKAKVHLGLDLNRGIPQRVYLSVGKADERPFVEKILAPGQTGVMARYYSMPQELRPVAGRPETLRLPDQAQHP